MKYTPESVKRDEELGMKVTLVNAPFGFMYNPKLSYSYPLGLMYIASTLERHKIQVKILDLAGENSMRRIRQDIKENPADIFGVSVFSDNRLEAFNIINIIKTIYPKARVVVGGPHPTIMYGQMLENQNVDAVFLGESEQSFLKYAQTVRNSSSNLSSISGIAFRNSSGTIILSQPEIEADIDNIPIPAFHLIELNRYKNRLDEIDFHIVTSRGCPFRCNFCYTAALSRGSYRVHSVSRVLEEMSIIESFNRNGRIMFHDDFFAADTERTRMLCENILKRNIRLKWSARSRVDSIDLETLRLMKQSGCMEIFYGVETGSEKILKAMNKNICVDDIKKAFSRTKQAGIKAACNIMIGYPGEDETTLQETKALLSVIKPDDTFFSAVRIFPGTQLHECCVREGIVSDLYWKDIRNKAPFCNLSISYIRALYSMYQMRMVLAGTFFNRLFTILKIILKEFYFLFLKLRDKIIKVF